MQLLCPQIIVIPKLEWDECRLLAGNSEMGRSSPPACSDANPNHNTNPNRNGHLEYRMQCMQCIQHNRNPNPNPYPYCLP